MWRVRAVTPRSQRSRTPLMPIQSICAFLQSTAVTFLAKMRTALPGGSGWHARQERPNTNITMYVLWETTLNDRLVPATHAEAPASQLKSEEQILRLLAPIYRDLGSAPAELVKVTPSYGGWLNALRFCIVRADNATTWITRKDIDTENWRRLMRALTSFNHEPHPGCLDTDTPPAAPGKLH